jgi:hypothetical protein
MSREEFTGVPDDELLDLTEEVTGEVDQRDVRLSRSLGGLANRQAEIAGVYEEVDPFLEPGSPAAKSYAHGTGVTGSRRWMEPFAKIDMFGRPTVFSDDFDPLDRRMQF